MTYSRWILAIAAGWLCATAGGQDVVAQPDTAWVRHLEYQGHGNETARDIAIDDIGNVYATGYTVGPSFQRDVATIKFNPIGDTVWVRVYDGLRGDDDDGLIVDVDSLGNVYVAAEAHIASASTRDILVLKYDSSGSLEWDNSINGTANSWDRAQDLEVDAQGNIFVTGWVDNTGTNTDMMVAKYHSDGTLLWLRNYDGPAGGYGGAYALTLDDSGNVYITGNTAVTTSDDVTTIKFDTDGNLAWVRHLGIALGSTDVGQDVTVDGVGNVYVAGYTHTGLLASRDCVTVKYDPNGNELWARTFNGPVDRRDEAKYIAVDQTGNVYVAGRSIPGFWSQSCCFDYLTIKYNSDGDTLWSRNYNSPTSSSSAWDEPFGLGLDDAGNVYVTGKSDHDNLGSTGNDVATLKYSPDGDLVWEERFNNPDNNDDQGLALAMTDDGANLYVAGLTSGFGGIGWAKFLVIKYEQQLCDCPNQGDVAPLAAPGDGVVDVLDVVAVIDEVFRSGPTTAQDASCPHPRGDLAPATAGVQCGDGVKDVLDVVATIDHVFRSGPAPCDPCSP